MSVIQKIPALAFGLALSAVAALAQEWVPVTDGKSAAGLTKYGATGNVEYSATGVIKTTGSNAYLATNKEYTHFRTRIEWNNPNGGNTGFLFHVVQDRIWPLGLECQMHSDDVGSLWTTGAKFDSRGVRSGNDWAYSEAANATALEQHGTTGTGRNHFIRSQNPGVAINTWNQWEMYVKGDSLEIKVNGKVVMRVWKLTIDNGKPLTKGRIGLQIEGATVNWRNWEIQDLASTAVLSMPGNALERPRGERLRIGSAVSILDIRPGASRLADLNGRTLSLIPVDAR